MQWILSINLEISLVNLGDIAKIMAAGKLKPFDEFEIGICNINLLNIFDMDVEELRHPKDSTLIPPPPPPSLSLQDRDVSHKIRIVQVCLGVTLHVVHSRLMPRLVVC